MIDSNMNYQIGQENAEPLVFYPQIDWEVFSEQNIIHNFWHKSVFFWSEENARKHRSMGEQVDGLYLTMDQAVYSIPITQSALFAFE